VCACRRVCSFFSPRWDRTAHVATSLRAPSYLDLWALTGKVLWVSFRFSFWDVISPVLVCLALCPTLLSLFGGVQAVTARSHQQKRLQRLRR
jgi:hypothetical protein